MDRRILAVSGDAENLPALYEHLLRNFPKARLHSYEQFDYLLRETGYKLMLLEWEGTRELIGYCFSYPVMGTGVVWLDYLTILEQHQGQDYEQIFFTMILNHYREHGDAFLFIAEKPDGFHGNPANGASLYDGQGARFLSTCFFLPTPDGIEEMNLLLLPFSGGYHLTARKQRDVLKAVYSILLCDVDQIARKDCEQRTAQTIMDEPYS